VKVSGKIASSWGFEVMFDPAKTQTFTSAGVPVTDDKILQDAAVVFTGLKGQELAVGQKKITLTEEALRSPSEIDFVERARITRTFGDRRETGLFYKGELGRRFNAWACVTNGTAANAPDSSNDTVFAAARLDFKPAAGLIVGASGGSSGGETTAHLRRQLLGGHVKYDGPDSFPIGLRFEYLAAKDGQAGGPELSRDGFFATVLYSFRKRYQVAVRYDEFDKDSDTAGSTTRTLTVGFHYLIKGRNINLKLDYFRVTEQGRKIAGVLAEDYGQAVLAAQAAF
jgi:hypothetical protein